MKPSPAGWPRITPGLYYRDAAAAIDWLCAAFGFTVRLRVENADGSILHSELEYGGGLIMVGQEEAEGAPPRFPRRRFSPRSSPGNTQDLALYVEDVDAHYARAKAAGATIVAELEVHDYGEAHWADRSYGALDPDGHLWWFSQRLRG